VLSSTGHLIAEVIAPVVIGHHDHSCQAAP
jgi:hypothetical protein